MSESDFINQLSQLGRKILPEDAKLWLYGSRARHEARTDSDWDLLVLLNKDKEEFDDFGRYVYPFVELGADANQIVSPQIYTQKDWQRMWFAPFVKNVEHDKIELV